TPTATATATETPTNTPTATATATQTPTNTPTATATATASPTNTPTNTPTATATATATATPIKYALGNLVWLDIGTGADTNDGVRDVGEPNAGAGVVLELLSGTGLTPITDTLSGQPLTTTTDSNGYYRFDQLDAGSYVVRVAASNFISGGALVGYVSSDGQRNTFATADNNIDHGNDAANPSAVGAISAKVILGVSEPLNEVDAGATGKGQNGPSGDANDNLTVDFGFYPLAKFGNFVWIESDFDGIAATGVITPVVGKVITATDETGRVYTTQTNATGYYTFSVPANHTYTVNYGPAPLGTTPSNTPNDNSASNSDMGLDQQSRPNGVTVLLRPGDVILTIDFGFTQLSGLGDRVWEDQNMNGRQDAGEPGIGNVTVTLQTPTGTLIAITDSNGNYTFTNLLPGVPYTVTFSPPLGYQPTISNAVGVNDADDSDGLLVPNIVLGPNEFNPTIDSGFYRPVRVGDYVWFDNDHDGTQGLNEPGVPTVTVRLYNAISNTLLATTTTNASGFYLFSGLPPGSYYVQFDLTTLPAGYTITQQNVGNDARDSDADLSGRTAPTGFIASGGENLTLDLGIRAFAGLGDRVWEDLNHNGRQDVGEPSLASVSVTLQTPSGLITKLTDANGYYSFTELIPGVVYTVTFGRPNGYQPTLQNAAGISDALDSDADVVTGIVGGIVLGPNEFNPTIDAGFWRPASLGDYVWLDVDNNGLQDASEPGVANVVVALYSNGQLVDVTRTNANGGYEFGNLISGTYSVTFQLPGGYTFATPNVGSDEGRDSDADAVTGVTQNYVVNAGEHEPRVDAGLYQPPSLVLSKSVQTPRGGAGTSVRPGDRLIYTILVRNNGNTLATNVVVTDPIESLAVKYVPGSAVPAPTRIEGVSIIWDLGSLNPGQSVALRLEVEVVPVDIASVAITNVAQISGRESGVNVISRGSNVVDNPYEPSAVTLQSFAAARMGDNVRVKWVTLAEIDTWSFALYRVEGRRTGSNLPADATLVTPNSILAEGRGGAGGSYEFVDTTAAVGKTYTYWLVETETSGQKLNYGPAHYEGGTRRLFLPLIRTFRN
ncbi:MAG: carboxypeptidase regulatory-like domain-containing protein, partial [Anaerolineae bacterium]|nr:carboxypeptidase regulatory-like domain-containing protein [Anaerolineae bacterium]